MLPRKNRLTGRDVAPGARPKNGKRMSTTHLSLYAARTQKGYTRFAIRVPKSIVPGSVARHLWKRRIAAALRGQPAQSLDITITLRAAPPGGAALQEEITQLFGAIAEKQKNTP